MSIKNDCRPPVIETRRSDLFPASVSASGGLTDALGISLEQPPTAPLALVVSEAQWADGTSLATLQGTLAGPNAGVLLVVSHSEIMGYPELSFRQLSDTAGRLGSFEQHRLEPLTVAELAPAAATEEVARLLVERSGGLCSRSDRSGGSMDCQRDPLLGSRTD